MPKEADNTFMHRALALAQRGRGYVEPNPVVGCVIVKGGRVVGEGYHQKFGGPHAEVEALRKAGRAARGATVYVTLEPCCHHGKTPPCTEGLIEAGVSRVVAACRDPFPKVAGLGIARLKKAGIAVQVGVCRTEAEQLNAPFFKRVRAGMPYVIAKWAMTVDGAIATSRGDSKWISNEESRQVVHELRARVDAVIVGIGTVLADDPMLTARGVKVRRIARRIVIDPSLRLPLNSKLVKSVGEAPLTVVTGPDPSAAKLGRLCRAGVTVVLVRRRRDGSLDLRECLKHVHDRDGSNVMVEGGGRTLGAFFEQGLVDEAQVFLGPIVLGDPSAVRPVVMDMRAVRAGIGGASRLELVESRHIRHDTLLRYRVYPAGPGKVNPR